MNSLSVDLSDTVSWDFYGIQWEHLQGKGLCLRQSVCVLCLLTNRFQQIHVFHVQGIGECEYLSIEVRVAYLVDPFLAWCAKSVGHHLKCCGGI